MKKRFIRQDSSTKKLEIKWRKPKGRDSKIRQKRKAFQKMPEVGFRTPKKFRYLRFGYKEVRISGVKDLEGLDPKTQKAILAKGIGIKKKQEIIKKAEELGIKIANIKMQKL